MNMRSCVICGKEFKPSHNYIMCCSIECGRVKSALIKTKGHFGSCVVCGKRFWVYPSTPKRKYCSNSCSFVDRKGKPKPHTLEWSKHISEAKLGKKLPHRMKLPAMKPCEYCGNPIDTVRSSGGNTRGKGRRRFCNLECWYNFLRVKPENNPTWSGGYDDPYYGSNWPQQRRITLKRDRYRCTICGKTSRQTRLDVHHIKPFKGFPDWQRANELNNLITVCISCHQKAAYGKVSYPLPLI